MHSIFVSDLHLSPERPRIVQAFLDFARTTATHAEAVYILGDLFEYWIGDDDLAEAFNARIADALGSLARGGVAVYLMHGNRDMLLGQAFAGRTGAKLIADPLELDLYGSRTLLMHGDTLCTDDVDYQKFRVYARDPENQRNFLARPLPQRREQALGMRAESLKSKEGKPQPIMDVTTASVEAALRSHGYPRLVHGHTHRPGRHVHLVDGRECERWVLPDWYERGGYLRCDATGCTEVTL
jgi:UDP-2,3-diacylglucosamine hydrolase